MMAQLKQSWLVWPLLLCLVLVSGFLAAPAVAHADHHAKHQAGTHSTGLCAWECAAGQSIDTAVVVFSASLQFIELADTQRADRIAAASPVSRFLRGPPALLS
ncbi:hypothetical protein [Nitrospira lenta]|uniref:Uncharacterized protein n=1 Tax=Nitrospira lenta TaxID=1436998 RepID=A0A330L9X6_9BACT|nr:hypothetical protein [Nitrospira lenta]SPP63746.1 conserved exported hypothetical protein [Nitrospira lenta]